MIIEDVADVVRKSRLGWFGQLERMDAEDWLSACRNIAIVGNAGEGRPRNVWNVMILPFRQNLYVARDSGIFFKF